MTRGYRPGWGVRSRMTVWLTPPGRETWDSTVSSYLSSTHLGDARGLTGPGAVATAAALALVGAGIDVVAGPGLGSAFGVLYTLGCVAGAWLVHREALRTTIVMPPLVFLAVAVLTAPFFSASRSGSVVLRLGFGVLNALVIGAPVLLLATALTAVVAGYRWRVPPVR